MEIKDMDDLKKGAPMGSTELEIGRLQGRIEAVHDRQDRDQASNERRFALIDGKLATADTKLDLIKARLDETEGARQAQDRWLKVALGLIGLLIPMTALAVELVRLKAL